MKVAVTVSAVLAALVLSLETGAAQRASTRRPATRGPATGRAAPRAIPPRTTPLRPAAQRAASQREALPREAALRIGDTTVDDLRAWDTYVTQRLSTGSLRVRRVDQDPALPFRTIERLQAFHQGLPIWGADVVRDSESGVPHAIFGELTPDFAIDTRPILTEESATRRVLAIAGPNAGMLTPVSLTILPRAGEQPRLAYMAVASAVGDVVRVFVDASNGDELLRYSEIHAQAAVGTGRGVLGDTKKLSVRVQGGAFLADDQHRPPVLTTFDFRNNNLPRVIAVVENGAPLLPSDIATDADNNWTDPAIVDAHAHVGLAYDYFFKRFGRRGLDDRDRPIVILTNAVSQQGALSLSPDQFLWALNAFWCGECGPGGVGVIFFGNGIPPGFFVVDNGRNYTHFAGALDIAAHELTHGVTDSSSQLINVGESGALNEAFSDIMATGAEFFFHPAGSGPRRADYLIGEDIARALRAGSRDGVRSMENPGLYGQPDHVLGMPPPQLDIGVHFNSTIVSHAFYLAVEGGVNRTSGVGVQGVGAANREQIERVFYRAFVFLLPSSATFSTARAATIQAARDLYGSGSAPERAVTQAWAAVGVF